MCTFGGANLSIEALSASYVGAPVKLELPAMIGIDIDNIQTNKQTKKKPKGQTDPHPLPHPAPP